MTIQKYIPCATPLILTLITNQTGHNSASQFEILRMVGLGVLYFAWNKRHEIAKSDEWKSVEKKLKDINSSSTEPLEEDIKEVKELTTPKEAKATKFWNDCLNNACNLSISHIDFAPAIAALSLHTHAPEWLLEAILNAANKIAVARIEEPGKKEGLDILFCVGQDLLVRTISGCAGMGVRQLVKNYCHPYLAVFIEGFVTKLLETSIKHARECWNKKAKPADILTMKILGESYFSGVNKCISKHLIDPHLPSETAIFAFEVLVESINDMVVGELAEIAEHSHTALLNTPSAMLRAIKGK